jgi:biotin operon repressor
MSIHVISAVLNCRDPELTSSRRMVLVCLANYAGDDGHSWPSQQLIADESGCGIRSVKDHLKWLEENGFMIRKTKSLGQGNGSRTSYHIMLPRLSRTPLDARAEIAGANIARAKSRNCEGSIPPLTNRQEPSITTANAVVVRASAPPPIAEQPKRAAQPKSSARGSRIPSNWTPTPQDYAFAASEGLTREEINREADKFRDYWTAASGRNACKLDWQATWRNWIRSDLRKRPGAGNTSRNGSRTDAFDRLAERLSGGPAGPDLGHHDATGAGEGYVIDVTPTRLAG